MDCSKLDNVILPDGLESIGSDYIYSDASSFANFAVILSPRASSLSSTYSKQCRRTCSAS